MQPLELATIAHVVFDRQGWTWGGLPGDPAHIPTREEIANFLSSELIERVLSGETIASESGRLFAQWDEIDESVAVYLRLGNSLG